MATSCFRSRSVFGSGLRSVLPSALLLAAAFSTSCAKLWSGQTKADPGNCVAIPELCSENQHCNLSTEACEWNDGQGPDDLNPLPAVPASQVFPGGLGGIVTQHTFPRDAKYALAAQDPSVVIHYTTDGTVPVPGASGTKSETAPALFAVVPGGTTIRWFADYGPAFAPEPIHVFTANTNPTPPDTFGFIPEPAKLDPTGGPVLIVSPGTLVTGTVFAQVWSSTPTGYCPGCIVQYVVAVKSLGAVGCVENTQAFGPYPGATTTVPFMFNAPSQPGRYPISSGLTLQFYCDGSVDGGPEIGAVIVK